MNELKNCPFCDNSEPTRLGTLVICRECGAILPSAAAWNTRPDTEPADEVIAVQLVMASGTHLTLPANQVQAEDTNTAEASTTGEAVPVQPSLDAPQEAGDEAVGAASSGALNGSGEPAAEPGTPKEKPAAERPGKAERIKLAKRVKDFKKLHGLTVAQMAEHFKFSTFTLHQVTKGRKVSPETTQLTLSGLDRLPAGKTNSKQPAPAPAPVENGDKSLRDRIIEFGEAEDIGLDRMAEIFKVSRAAIGVVASGGQVAAKTMEYIEKGVEAAGY